MRIHTYIREQSGTLTHGTRYAEDMGDKIGVTGEIEELLGWPTPAMRQGVDGNGEPATYYVGTDEAGKIIACR